jgi:hypothetical protein
LFGPHEKLGKYTIQVGVVGTPFGISLYEEFVKRINKPIMSTDEISRPSFPGFENVFGIKWPVKPAIARELNPGKIQKILLNPNVRFRTYDMVTLYIDAIETAQLNEETKVDIWVLTVPKDIWLKCRTNSETVSESNQHLQAIKSISMGQGLLFEEFKDEYEEEIKALEVDWDFHDQLKARLLFQGILTPVQIILEPTLQFKDKYKEKEFEENMKAHLAWTQSTTIYYKMGRLPWKLSDIRKGICYIGLVFKKYGAGKHSGYACSAAQMFLDSGDGTVFKGNNGPWMDKDEKEYHLKRDSAKALISLALKSYFERNGKYPGEIFIHGRASFKRDEWAGFIDAVDACSSNTKLVGIVIKESSKLKLFREIESEECKYGVLRGLAFSISEKEGYLWTKGFVPRLNTSTSIEIPNPLRVIIDKGDENLEQILKDILSLTKLNYNGLPVTLRFSDRVGNILTAVENIGNKALPFKYYI